MTAPRLLLISSSTVHGSGYLDHCAGEIRDLLGGSVRRVLFVPFALADRDGYAAKARERFAAMGYGVDALHQAADAPAAVAAAEAVFVGGGNTFRLLSALWALGVVEPLRRRVGDGMPYLGASAGTNVACPTIRTTNDMPIVEPPTFEALGLVGFQINPHYLDPDPSSTHRGETREQRLVEYLEENERPVVGLREGAMLRVEGAAVELRGTAAARLFRRGGPPEEHGPGSRLEGLLPPPAVFG
ncbi:MAG TPA: dipeptidase PepE [Thermoanaerobaculia bacterium]|nr:dipeptidase PepE [Thermoanaerobaculia bacterium]